MSKANRAATAQAAQHEGAPGPNGKKEAKWPVASASELTEAHVPPKVRDQIARQWRRRAEAVSRLLVELVDAKNDIMNGINGVAKAANKDAQRLQGFIQSPEILTTLTEFGLVRPNQPPVPAAPKGDGDA